MKIYNILLLLLICLLLASCHTMKKAAIRRDVPAITENRLMKNIEGNGLEYNTIFAKRVDVSLVNKKGNSNSFRASLKIQRDSFIQVALTAPLGIEVARVLFTQDSIKFVDIFHKKYILKDYNYFYDKFDAHINYDFLQNILTNTFFNFEIYGETVKNKKYKLDRVESGYELSTLEERALSRKIKKLYKKRRKNKDFILILQKILIDPQTFRPLSVSIEDIDEDMGISVNYESFQSFSNKLFPEKIVFDLFSDHSKTSLVLKFQKIEFDVPVDANFRISPKYKMIE